MIFKIKKLIKEYKYLFALTLGLTFKIAINFSFDLTLNFKTLLFVYLGYHVVQQITRKIDNK